jgi:2-iminobutanoate/2-iminopropanoate deaminase
MKNTILDLGVSKLIGSYSDAVIVPPNARWLYTSGTPGIELDGTVPKGIEAQTEVLWRHLLNILKAADMGPEDLVKVSTSLLHAEHMAPYVAVRKRILGDTKPAFMIVVVNQLVRPEFLVEAEIVAAKAA